MSFSKLCDIRMTVIQVAFLVGKYFWKLSSNFNLAYLYICTSKYAMTNFGQTSLTLKDKFTVHRQQIQDLPLGNFR